MSLFEVSKAEQEERNARDFHNWLIGHLASDHGVQFLYRDDDQFLLKIHAEHHPAT